MPNTLPTVVKRRTPSCTWTQEYKDMLGKRLRVALIPFNDRQLTPALAKLILEIKSQTVSKFCKEYQLTKPICHVHIDLGVSIESPEYKH